MRKYRWFKSTVSNRMLWKCLLLLVFSPVLVSFAATPDDVVLYLPLEDAQNPVDLSANPASLAVHGTVNNADGQFGSKGLELDGNNANRLEVVHADKLEGMSAITIEAWVMPYDIASNDGLSVVSKRVGYQDGDVYNVFTYSGPVVNARINGQGGNALISTTQLENNTWYHVAFVFDGTGSTGDKVKLYINGVLEVSGDHPDSAVNTGGAPVWVGELDANRGMAWNGVLDEIGIWNIPLMEEEINLVMNEGKAKMFRGEMASNPIPTDGAAELLPDTDLLWTPGTYAATHNVYFGTTWADVNSASLDNPLDILVSEDQDANTFDLDTLALGQTYFWRIDEVNAPPDRTLFKGDIWSFTVEPVSYPIPMDAVSVTVSSSDPTSDPNNIINGVGLDENDQHSNDQVHMWLAGSTDSTPSLLFDLSQVEKLDKVHVWNHNTQTEAILGFGIKEALIEYSADGEAWSELGTVELPQAAGANDYTGTDVPLEAIVARYIKITGLSNWSILGLPQRGLSEVRFYAVPVQARNPAPADGSTRDGVDVTLQWRTGREAVEHEVVFSDNEQAVIDGSAVVATVSESLYNLGTLDLGTAYFWKINEMNDLGTPPVYEGDLWTFLSPNHLMIDDFEMYQAQEGLRIWEHWLDGFDNPGDNGAVVGNGDDAERSVVYEGGQSMPVAFNNTTAPASEVTRFFDTPVDLTKGNPDSLKIQVHGDAPGLVIDGDTITLGASGSDLWNTADEGRFVYKTLTGDGSITAKVESLVNVDVWTKAGVMIRESDGADAADAYTVTSAASGLTFQYRLETYASAASDSGTRNDFWANHNERPVWVRVERIGDEFNGYISLDGTSWEPSVSNPQTIAMIQSVKIGLCVTSHNNDASTVAVFSSISTTGDVTGNWEWVEWGGGDSGHPNNDAAPMYVRLADSSGKEITIDHPNPNATITQPWDEWTIPLADLGSVNINKIESITVGVGSAGVQGKIFVDAIRTDKPYPASDIPVQ